jgi:regulator of sigma E protease
MLILYIAFALLGIGIIIFIHEAGHFLAAKKVGVRVERFALGFDPPFRGRKLRFFAFRRGETEYVLGMIPFGGYVKLAGEMVPESGKSPAPDELLAKSIGARALVFVAGAVMNILSAFLFFMIAFTIGVSFTEPTLGTVVPGSPAWKAGLQPGDTVVQLNGKEVTDFMEVAVETALSGRDQKIRLKVQREVPPDPEGADRDFEELVFEIQPKWNPQLGFHNLGLLPPDSPRLEQPPAGSAAEEAGIRMGDVLIGAELKGRELPRLSTAHLISAIQVHLSAKPGEAIRLRIDRDGDERWIDIRPRADSSAAPQPLAQVLMGGGTVVRDIAPGSSARGVFRPGDKILSIDDRPGAPLHWLPLLEHIESSAAEKLSLGVESSSGERRALEVAAADLLLWNLRQEILWDDHPVVGRLAAGSSLRAAGLEDGDVVVAAAGEPFFDPQELAELLSRVPGERLDLEVLRQGKRLLLSAPRSALEASAGVEWRTFGPIAYRTPGGPADRAGITAGSRVVRLGEKEIFTWEEFTRAVKELDTTKEVAIQWIDAAGEHRQGKLRVGVPPVEELGLRLQQLKRVVRTGVLDSFAVGARRTIVIGKQVFLTLRSLIKRDVSAKNLAGPIGITHIFTRVAEYGLGTFIYFMAMISVNLGLLNLLPLPILDGGHLLFLGIEKIKGSPVDIRVQEWATNIAFLLIISLALFVTFHDIQRLFW